MLFDKVGFTLVNACKEAAVAAAHTMGHGDKRASDEKAVTAMRTVLGGANGFRFRIVTGEGERDKAPLLFHGETIGSAGAIPTYDLAVDPLEGTNLCATAQPNAISVIAASIGGGIRQIPDWYLDKLVVGHAARDRVDIDAPLMDNVSAVARSLDCRVEDLVVGVLNRERHKPMIEELKKHKVRINLISDGDLSLGLAVALGESNLHMAIGIGGAPEGVITAVGMKCLNGAIQVKVPHPDRLGEEERRKMPAKLEERLEKCGFGSYDRVYCANDLVPGEQLIVVATGVTKGDILQGVRFFGTGIKTQTLVATLDRDKTQWRKITDVDGGLNTVFRFR